MTIKSLVAASSLVLSSCTTWYEPSPVSGPADGGTVDSVREHEAEADPAGVYDTAGDVSAISRTECRSLLERLEVTFSETTQEGVATAVQLSRVRGATLRYATASVDGTLLTDCRTAVALGEFARLLAEAGSPLRRILHVGSYNKRYIDGTTTWSMHAFALAVDLRGFEFADATTFRLPDHWDASRRAYTHPNSQAVVTSLRKAFATVYGPELNAAHVDHFHAGTLIGAPVSPDTDPCSGRVSGDWCALSLGIADPAGLVTCRNGLTAETRSCRPGTCQSMALGTNDVCSPAPSTPSITVSCPSGAFRIGDAISCSYVATGLSTDPLRAVLRDPITKAERATASSTLSAGAGAVAIDALPIDSAPSVELCVTSADGSTPRATGCTVIPVASVSDGLLVVDPHGSLSGFCGSVSLVTWTSSGSYESAPGAPLSVPVSALGRGVLNIGARCVASGTWYPFPTELGRTARELGMTALLEGTDVANTMRVCHDNGGVGNKLALGVPGGTSPCP